MSRSRLRMKTKKKKTKGKKLKKSKGRKMFRRTREQRLRFVVVHFRLVNMGIIVGMLSCFIQTTGYVRTFAM